MARNFAGDLPSEPHLDPALLLMPGFATLGCFLLYGPAEAMLNFSGFSVDARVLYVLFSAALFLFWGWGRLRMERRLVPGRGLRALSWLLFAAAVPFYLLALHLALENVRGKGAAPFLFFSNPVPELLAVGPTVKLEAYHLAIFGLFFPLLYWSLAVLLFRASEMRVREKILRLFAAWLGWGALGLTYQDGFYFVSHPTQDLVPGGRYGVYFTHWLGPLPTVYLLAHLWGLGWLALAWRKTQAWPAMQGVVRLVALLAATGVVLTLVKPLWAG